MNYITNILKKLSPEKVSTSLGRWRIEKCTLQINRKLDLSNEDHCGPCGQYVVEKNKLNNNTDIYLEKK